MNFSFEDFQPMMYPVRIGFGANKGNKGEGDVSINNRPFILQKITHQLVNPKPDVTNPDVSIQALQDGLYRINWSLYNQRRYFQGDVPMADAAFGSVRHGIWIPLSVPLLVERNRTLNVEVTNELDRDPIVKQYELQVIFIGLEDIRDQARQEK